MNLDEAIEIIEKEEEDTFMGSEEKWKNALKLSSEAIREIKRLRSYKAFHVVKLLPGETKE